MLIATEALRMRIHYFHILRLAKGVQHNHDFLYVCQVKALSQHMAEFEGQWVPLEGIQNISVPEDIQSAIARLLFTVTSESERK